MKKIKIRQALTAVHVVEKEWLNPYNPIVVNLIGAGGTGSQVLTALGRMNHALIELNHPGLFVRLFDDDKVERANLGRQLFATAELKQYKAVALINRVNLFFGTNWKAVTARYDKASLKQQPELAQAGLTISCVDTVQARLEIADILKTLHKHSGHSRNKPLYCMDFGNSRFTGQVILSTIGKVPQPEMKKYQTVDTLPMVTDEFRELLLASESADKTPSCSLAEALTKQDLFINSALANAGASLLWQLFREGMLVNRGFFLNLKDFRMQPIKVTQPVAVIVPLKPKKKNKKVA
ncbi:PRTRC system ThiF family protein [Mucilaginibacter sp. HC2]|uniref:PRTRC system ThiF family protein n=1 Tax=Mucilaginibacter TaxID=423349 RepID=UPI000DCDA4D8|nr:MULTISPECIES: PRTRC system ThiF family protein [Mucilaginibacter]NHA05583.1 PRTRC system ThiF family protein [Mucilaginibacter inviolabilis]QTE35391.1 PRTRC system ThiF family protein [Mucilaginibacter gossypii]RAV59409.1 PRTRC system ThiF family protein [Mucilaginibacter rubeus]